jgi:hypothetical protein
VQESRLRFFVAKAANLPLHFCFCLLAGKRKLLHIAKAQQRAAALLLFGLRM